MKNTFYFILVLLFLSCGNNISIPKTITLENRAFVQNCGINEKVIQDSFLINGIMDILNAEHEELDIIYNGLKWYIEIELVDKFANDSYNRPIFLYHEEYGYLIKYRRKLFKSRQLELIIIKEMQLGC